MNAEDYSENLIKQIDLIYYWEPFAMFTGSSRKANLNWRTIYKDFRQSLTQNNKENSSNNIVSWNKSILFGFDTINQYHALSKIIDGFGDLAEVVSLHPAHRTHTLPNEELEAMGRKHQWDIIKAFATFKRRDREVLADRYYKMAGLLGLYEWMHLSMRASKPKLKYFIGANDHSGLSQIGFVAARKTGIKTIYIQHASISDKFPPLSTDYALLDGQDALDKYTAAGAYKTQAHLVGASKYDAYLNNQAIDTPGNLIGICIGHILPNHTDFETLCNLLQEKRTSFCLRFHPAVTPDIRQKYLAQGWTSSNPEEEGALDFIIRCHTLVSADSNILLEAILLKRRPIYLSHDASIFDYYGFLKRKVLEGVCYRAEEVMDMLDQTYLIEQYRTEAKYYQDTLYTEWEGQSAELVIQKLKAITGC